MRHEMLSQRAPFCIGAMAKKGTLSQHFVTHVVPPLQLGYCIGCPRFLEMSGVICLSREPQYILLMCEATK